MEREVGLWAQAVEEPTIIEDGDALSLKGPW